MLCARVETGACVVCACLGAARPLPPLARAQTASRGGCRRSRCCAPGCNVGLPPNSTAWHAATAAAAAVIRACMRKRTLCTRSAQRVQRVQRENAARAAHLPRARALLAARLGNQRVQALAQLVVDYVHGHLSYTCVGRVSRGRGVEVGLCWVAQACLRNPRHGANAFLARSWPPVSTRSPKHVCWV